MTADAERRAVTIPMADWNRQVESSGIAEYGRLKAEHERDYFYVQRDRYKAALLEIVGDPPQSVLEDGYDAGAYLRGIAREALQQEQA